jgi:hypothetical protein
MRRFLHRLLILTSFFTLPMLFTGICAASDFTTSDFDVVMKKNLSHPYLYFTNEEKQAIITRSQKDPESRDIMERLLAECNRLLFTPVDIPIPREIRDSRYDLSDNSLNISGNYRHSAYILAFIYQMTGDERYAKKAYEFADAICDMDTWVMRACQFPKAYTRVSPWNVPDEKIMFSFDIIAGDISVDMAAVYDWLYPALNKYQRDRIRGALLEKAIVQVRGDWNMQWWATAYRCNWCTWCCSGLGLAALALYPEHPDLTDMLAETFNRCDRTLSFIDPEGGWQEGASYWSQTMRMSVLFADAMKRATNGKMNLFANQKLAAHPSDFGLFTFVPPDGGINIGDASFHKVGSARYYNRIAIEYQDGISSWMRKNIYNEGDDIFDVIWPKNTVSPKLPDIASLHFSYIDWTVMRSDFTDPNKVMVACKAGMLDDPHHGHLDCGQFMVYWHGKGYICDLGTAAYDEKYFDAEKYETPQASGIGHNLIFVNGESEIPGKLKDKPLNTSIGGKVLDFRTSPGRDYTLMDPTNAFPKKELKEWRRHVILEKPVITVVVDEVSAKKGAEIEARFHSDCTQIVKDGYTLIDGPDGDMALIPVMDTKYTFRPDKHAYMALHKQARIQWIPYNGTVLTAPSDRTVLAHVILPVKDDAEAKAIVKSAKRSGSSGDFSLSFMKDGKKYEYKFKKTGDGLVLQ